MLCSVLFLPSLFHTYIFILNQTSSSVQPHTQTNCSSSAASYSTKNLSTSAASYSTILFYQSSLILNHTFLPVQPHSQPYFSTSAASYSTILFHQRSLILDHTFHQRSLILTLTLEPLVDEPVEEGAAVVAEGGAGVGVYAEPVLRAVILHIYVGGCAVCTRTHRKFRRRRAE